MAAPVPMAGRTRRVLSALLATAVLAGAAACGGGREVTTLKIRAASSLTEVMAALGAAYERRHRGVLIRTAFAGSQELVSDIRHRARSDVLVTADPATMDLAAKLVTGRRLVVAYNSMTIAVGPGDPKHIRGLADLASPRIRVVIGAPTVPAGRYALQLFAKAALTVRPVEMEADVRSVLTQVRTGEADAGIVYITDLKSAGSAASSVPIPAAQNVTASYLAAVVKRTEHEDAATAFTRWLASAEARTVFHTYGFSTP